MSERELAALEAAAKAATPGEWFWEVNLKSKRVALTSTGLPASMHEIVMDFVRWGMGGACPRLRKPHANRPDFVIMHRADEFAAVIPGREHHASWAQTLEQPDARHIAAANPSAVLRLAAAYREALALLAALPAHESETRIQSFGGGCETVIRCPDHCATCAWERRRAALLAGGGWEVQAP
jgi:hypothetical protein